jgi:hypothetical protein
MRSNETNNFMISVMSCQTLCFSKLLVSLCSTWEHGSGKVECGSPCPRDNQSAESRVTPDRRIWESGDDETLRVSGEMELAQTGGEPAGERSGTLSQA